MRRLSASEPVDLAMYRFLEWRARQFMTEEVRSVDPRATLRQLEAMFAQFDYNAFPVFDNGNIVGVVTKFDFLKAFTFTSNQLVPHYDDLMLQTVADVMTRDVVHVDAEEPLTRVLALMIKLRARSFPVLSDRQLVGMISREDLIRALHRATQVD